ncbi:MAG: copper chaperone PCu(A)C [Pseudomonadota bacterium]
MFSKILLHICLLFGAFGASAQTPLTISDAWSPQAPPGRMMAGFMALSNDSEESIVLIGGESERFGRVEIHTMRMDDGVMRMRKLDQLEIPAGETVTLRPGGLHLMLMQPDGRFELGDEFALSLIDNNARHWPVTLEVRDRRRR